MDFFTKRFISSIFLIPNIRNSLNQGSANSGPWIKSSCSPTFVDKVVLKHSHPCVHIVYISFPAVTAETTASKPNTIWSFKKKFANPLSK